MSNKPLFINNQIPFENQWKNLSINDIEEAVPYDFFGKKEFIEFYLVTNGGKFTKGAYIYRDNFYSITKGDYNSLEVGSFFNIPLIGDNEDSEYTMSIPDAIDRRQGHSDEFDEFTLFNIPFADNFGDNDFWIDIQTGEIKYVDYESCYDPNDAIIVAPSFVDFCQKLQDKRRL